MPCQAQLLSPLRQPHPAASSFIRDYSHNTRRRLGFSPARRHPRQPATTGTGRFPRRTLQEIRRPLGFTLGELLSLPWAAMPRTIDACGSFLGSRPTAKAGKNTGGIPVRKDLKKERLQSSGRGVVSNVLRGPKNEDQEPVPETGRWVAPPAASSSRLMRS
jgi:hypothetical protein